MKLLRCRVGPYSGQLIEYPEHVADNLLQNGMAEKPTDEEVAAYYGPAEEQAVAPPVEVPEKPKRARRRKKKPTPGK